MCEFLVEKEGGKNMEKHNATATCQRNEMDLTWIWQHNELNFSFRHSWSSDRPFCSAQSQRPRAPAAPKISHGGVDQSWMPNCLNPQNQTKFLKRVIRNRFVWKTNWCFGNHPILGHTHNHIRIWDSIFIPPASHPSTQQQPLRTFPGPGAEPL